MKCQCSTRRDQLSLLVGQDALAELPEDVRRSLANCPQCREHYHQLCVSQQALEIAGRCEEAALQHSLWPELAGRLEKTQPRPARFGQFRRQFIPVFSMTAACLAVFVTFWDTRSTQNRVYQVFTQTPASSLSSSLLRVNDRASASANYSSEFPIRQGEFSAQRSASRDPFQIPHSVHNSHQGGTLSPHEEMLLEMLRSELERDLFRYRQ